MRHAASGLVLDGFLPGSPISGARWIHAIPVPDVVGPEGLEPSTRGLREGAWVEPG